MRKTRTARIALGALALVLAAGAGATTKDLTLNVIAYSTPACFLRSDDYAYG